VDMIAVEEMRAMNSRARVPWKNSSMSDHVSLVGAGVGKGMGHALTERSAY